MEPDGANRELKRRLKAAMDRQGLSQADIVRQTELADEAVSKATVNNALNPEKGPPSSFTLKAILNALGISGSEGEELSRLRARAHSRGGQPVVGAVSLPREPEGFVGRQDEIKELLEVLDPASGSQRTAVVVGMPGVGKSALALRAAHKAIEEGRFPGGALHVDLDGYAGEAEKKARQAVMNAAQALEVMLHTLGVTSEHMPPTEPGRAALYRAKLAERSGPVLILIDNAPTADAVKALLPGLGNHRVLVTSRHSFTSLPARHVKLKVLTVDESMELIDTALRLFDTHDRRVGEDPSQAKRLAKLCGLLPLALHVTAAILKGDRHKPLAHLADELDDERTRLKRLKYPDNGQLAVRAAFRVSYRCLTKDQQRLLRLLSHNPRNPLGETARLFRRFSVPLNPYLTTAHAAVLADSTPAEIRPLLLELTQAHLLEQHWWDRATPPERWRIHDLLLLFVKERAAKKASQDDAGEAIMRFLYFWSETELVHGIKAHVEMDDGSGFTVEFREELGDVVVVPTDEAGFEPAPGFEWNEEHGAWVNTEPNDTMRAAWEADEARRWGDGHITDEGTTEE